MTESRHYAEDLAYIHDQGFDFHARGAVPFLLKEFASAGISGGHIVSLGCGSGIAESALVKAGYSVTGFDQSPAMLKIAQRRCRTLDLQCISYVDATLPDCHAVIALGEVFNYQFDARSNLAAMTRVFRKVHAALSPGGLFVFDVAEPSRGDGACANQKSFFGENWALFVRQSKNRARTQLTREIELFRNVGRLYRRSREVHQLRLYRAAELATRLRDVGYRAHIVKQYGDQELPRGLRAVVARKPNA